MTRIAPTRIAPTRIAVILNRHAGRRRPERVRAMLDALTARGLDHTLHETTHAGHAAVLARQAAERGAGMVLAAGGDGTVSEVVNGLVPATAPISTQLGILPLGTANVVAWEWGLPFAPATIAAMVAEGHTRPLWPGLTRTGDQGEEGRRLFVQMVGIGFDAAVVHALPAGLKRCLGRAAYGVQTAREWWRHDAAPGRVEIDGVVHRAGSVVISKGRFYAGRFCLAPSARPDHPGFQVAILPPGRRAALLAALALPLNQLARLPGLCIQPARMVRLLDPWPSQIDGDRLHGAPMRITDAPAPVPLIVPRRDQSRGT